MASKVEVKCAHCGGAFFVRTADVNRGWGKHCSKSCKAKRQTKLTGIAGPNYRASGKTVNQMKNGHFAKSNFKSALSDRVILDEYGERKRCYCGEVATRFIQSGFGHNGWEGMCEDHVDDTHPFDSDNF